jgi:predicted house-cleaning noncanonical NTP pyrophosphatase (MazG superfamily)
MGQKYGKLVRDKIPEIIESNNEVPVIKILDDNEYKKELEKKLYEEYLEVLDSNGMDRVEELADMLEVMKALANLENKTLDDVIEVSKKKESKRGAFNKKIYLVKVLKK